MNKIINPAIFKKNLRRFWPVWAGYAFVMFWAVPFLNYVNLFMFSYSRTKSDIEKNVKSFFVDDSIYMMIIFAIIMSIIVALCVFGYMEQSTSISFFHALPTDRKALFFTNYLSGFVMILAPNMLAGLVTLLICACNNIGVLVEVLLWLLATTVIALFFYSLMVLCMVVSGVGPFAMVIYFVALLYYYAMRYIINGIGSMIAYGMTFSEPGLPGPLGILVPFSFFGKLTYANIFYKSGAQGLSSDAPMILITGFVCAALLTCAAFLLYRYRKSEDAGNFIAIDFLKPVFRWGFAFSFGTLMTALLMVTTNAKTGAARVELFIGFIFFGAIGFIIAQMLIMKSFRVIKKSIKELLVYLGVMVAASVVIVVCMQNTAKYIPDPDEIKEVNIYFGGVGGTYAERWTSDADFIRDLSEIHRQIIDEGYELEHYYEDQASNRGYEEFGVISIHYHLHDKMVNRSYSIPSGHPINDKLLALTEKYAVELAFGDARNAMINRAFVEIMIGDDSEYPVETTQLSYEISADSCRELFNACIRDVKEKNLTLNDISSSSFIDLFPYGKLANDKDRNMVRKYAFALVFDIQSSGKSTLETDPSIYYTIYFNDRCGNISGALETAGIEEITTEVRNKIEGYDY